MIAMLQDCIDEHLTTIMIMKREVTTINRQNKALQLELRRVTDAAVKARWKCLLRLKRSHLRELSPPNPRSKAGKNNIEATAMQVVFKSHDILRQGNF